MSEISLHGPLLLDSVTEGSPQERGRQTTNQPPRCHILGISHLKGE